MKIINMIIILIAKLISFILKLFGKKAGTLPGRIALKLNKNIRDFIKLKGKLIVVTGTNGKTTTTNMIYEILKKSNKSVICNNDGNNIGWGITTTLLTNCSIKGELNYDYVVIETDEHWLPIIYSKKNLSIDTLIVLNFFADQLDRTGKVETIIEKTEKFISNHFAGNLILNGNDPNVVRLGDSNKNGKNYFYGISKLDNAKNEHNKNVICPNCKSNLKYEYVHYSDIGKFSCVNCSYGKVKLNCEVTKINGNDFYVNKEKYVAANNALYNIYNLTSIVTLKDIYKLDKNVLNDVFENYKSNTGRFQKFKINGNDCILNLGKNPSGFNVVLNNIKKDSEKKELLLVLNDKINDGKDVSWIWDIDFSNMNSFDRIICCGIRAYDMAVAVKYKDYPVENIIVEHDIKNAVDKLFETTSKKYIISNYSPLPKTLEILKQYEEGDIK